MVPKKAKTFIKPTAEALEQPIGLVSDVVDFYWASVRRALSDLESPSISVTNLGKFSVRYKKIAVLERKCNVYLDSISLDNMSFSKHTIQNNSKAKLERLANIRKIMDEERARRLEVKAKRKAYVSNRGLEEQG